MKKLAIVCCVATMACGVALAGPHGPGGRGPGRGPAPMHHRGPAPMHHRGPAPHHHHHHGDGGIVAAGILGGALLGSAIVDAVRPAPVVVQQPVVVQPVTQVQNVWVEGRYVDQVQPNGLVVRVWQPAHYEQRTVVIQ